MTSDDERIADIKDYLDKGFPIALGDFEWLFEWIAKRDARIAKLEAALINLRNYPCPESYALEALQEIGELSGLKSNNISVPITMSLKFTPAGDAFLKALPIDLDPTEWTTTPPIVAGWYWVKDDPRRQTGPKVHCVDVREGPDERLVARVTGWDSHVPFEHFTHWLGPIEVPPAPEDKI